MAHERLTSAELIERLQSEERAREALEAQLDASAELERLLQELRTHQYELEAQNETLRQSQRELEESRKRYLDLYDSAPIPYCTFESKGVIRDINLPGAELLGRDRTTIIGLPFMAVARTKDPARLWQHLRECLDSDGPVTCELTLSLGPNVREFQLRSTAVRDASQSPQTCRTAFLDITDRRAVERQAAAAHAREAREHAAAKLFAERLTSAIESIEDALALYDANARLLLCNSAYRALVGRVVPGELIGKPYEEILDAWQAEMSDSDEARAQLAAARWRERHDARHFELRTRDRRSLRVMNRPTNEGGIVQTIWDLTADVQRERELSEARDAAERASAAKSDFLSSMSHELRTPLNAILGFAQLLMRDKKEPLAERHRQRVDYILKSGEHLLCLINEVLELSRIESGRLSISIEPVDLDALLQEITSTLGEMAERAQIDFSVEPSQQRVTVMADPTRLKQILMNYGSNAIKYGREGGHVRIRVSLLDHNVRLTVSDDGIGIAPENQTKIFAPFERAGQEAGPIEGTGIGLVISKRLAELMRGSVGFHSVQGEGSDFWVQLPTSSAAAALPRSIPRLAQVPFVSLRGSEGPRYELICIEDNASSVALMTDLLHDFERIQLVAATSAEVGIELVRARRPDVVIMDINLPGMSGVEARRRLAQWPETQDIPVIALSAAATEEDAEKIGAAGFQRYLTKPVRIDELARVLEEVLAPTRAP